MTFGTDEYGRVFKVLPDGRALHVEKRWHNTLMTLSSSVDDPGWRDSW